MEEISVRMQCLYLLPDSREGGDRITTIYNGDIDPGDKKLVMGDPGPVYIEGKAKLIQAVMKEFSILSIAFDLRVFVRFPCVVSGWGLQDRKDKLHQLSKKLAEYRTG